MKKKNLQNNAIPSLEEALEAGTLRKLFGYQGQFVLIASQKDIFDEIDLKEPVFLSIQGLLVPFFIEDFTESSQMEAVVTLRHIDTKEHAKRYLGSRLFIRNPNHPKKHEIYALQGYTIYDEVGNRCGEIKNISGTEANPLWIVSNKNKEYLLPAHKDLIISLDPPNKKLVFAIPAGIQNLD